LRHQRSLNRCPDYLNLGAGRITELNIKAYLALIKSEFLKRLAAKQVFLGIGIDDRSQYFPQGIFSRTHDERFT
jgi:hypothetical protein